MNNERDLILKEEVHRIVGCGMEVLNVLGHGFLLKVTGQEVGVILNFKRARLEWKRVVLQKNRE